METKKKPSKSKAEKDICRIITPKFRVSYPHLFKAQSVKGSASKPKFSITMLFPKDRDIMGSSPTGEPRSLKSVIRQAKLAEFGSKENWPKGLQSPVSDGDDPKYADKGGYKGCWVIKASTSEEQRPSVVGPDMTPITEPSELYPGCYARAYVYAYVWEFMGKRGVGFILDHVQKLADGESFGGRTPVEQVFSPVAEAASDDEDEDEDDDEDFT